MAKALITPDILAWARQRAQLSIEGLANKLHTDIDKLTQWELGEESPTFVQAKKIANILHIPFGYLFLSEPPHETLPIPDLRTIDNNLPDENISADFRDLLNDVIRKQQWYREHLLKSGHKPLTFIGQSSLDQTIHQVAESIRTALKLDHGQNRTNRHDLFLKTLVEKVEELGILVMRNSIVGSNTHRPLSVNEFRGFAISDDYAPLIFINTADARAAQIFTLAHELAHLWIGQSGISLPVVEQKIKARQNEDHNLKIERFCNQVAAELLTPQKFFINHWNKQRTLADNCQELVTTFHVSSLVIARRAYDLKQVTYPQFLEFYKSEQKNFEKIKKLKKKASGGGDFYRTLKVRNSNPFSTAVVVASMEGRLLLRDAAQLLNTQVKSLNTFADRLGIK